jgi:hypothetical protein
MKIGDKVLCINDCHKLHTEKYFIRGEYYTINNMFEEDEICVIEGYWFSINHVEGKWNFDDHFVDLRGCRKLKLEKINEEKNYF